MFIVLSFNVKITVFIAEFTSSSTAESSRCILSFFVPTPIIHSFLRPQISILINYSLPNMSIAIPLIFLSFLLFWVVRSFLRFNKELRRRNELGAKIFGPPANSLFGNLAMFPKCKYEWTAFLIDQSNKALEKGESMIRWWTGPTKLAIWTLNSDTSRMLLENTRELKKGRDYAFYEQWLGRGLLLSDGEIWREHRKALTPTFHFSMLDQYCAVFNRQAKILVQRLEMVEGKGQLDISPLLTRCSLDIIGEAAMGIRLNSQQNGSPDYVEAVHQFNFFAHVFNTNLLYWFPPFWKISGWKKKTRECVNVLKKFSKKVIEERINANGNIEESGKREGRGKAFLDLLLELEAEGRLNRKQVQEQMDTFLFAGHDTTASALGWTLWCLAAHPKCQKLARNEILEVIGGEGDAQIDANGANELRYLDRCLRESLRIFPPVPVVERDLDEDLWIGDKLVPKGTMVVVSPFILHHREKIYPRHWEFDPDNFLPERHSSRNSFDFVPFSAGPRNCIGQRFAFLELKILLVQILRRFSLSTDIPFLANRPGLEAILRPELGITVKIDAIEEC